MQLDQTPRGFSRADFRDAAGSSCSIQESSLASEACVWFGVHEMPGHDPKTVTRMHLTQEMTRQIGHAMRSAHDGDEVIRSTFVDHYGSTCVIAPGRAPGAVLTVGVLEAFRGDVGRPMELTRGMIEDLMPCILSFLTTGTLSGEGGVSALDDPQRQPLDVIIPASMLERANVGETEVSARELIDAFVRLFDYYEGDLAGSIGHDTAVRMEAIRDRLDPVATGN